MARSPRPGAAATPSSTQSTPAQALRISRRRQSVSTAAASTPGAGPSTPAAYTPDEPGTPGSARSATHPSRLPVERKAHALRSIGGAADRVPCPFPSSWGGSEKCGVALEDEADEVLMAVCAACALSDNRALSAEDLARISLQHGWLRPPTAAVEPTTPFNTAIRNHFKRCEKATPPRQPLLSKHQLTGAVAEQVLETALHPSAFAGSSRPKGTVYFLAAVASQPWSNPFNGLEMPKPIPKMHVKKAGLTKKAAKEKKDKSRTRVKAASGTPAPEGETAPVKIRLVLHPTPSQPTDAPETTPTPDYTPESSRESSEAPSGSMSRATSAQGTPAPAAKPKLRRPSNYLDSSDESDSSSEDEAAAARLRPMPIRAQRRSAPSPITISPRPSGSPRFAALGRLPTASPFRELFFPSPLTASFPACSQTQSQPAHYPAHSLDNTFWAARSDADRYAFETSSSSSDEDVRDGDWGQTSGILIRGGDDADAEMEDAKLWAAVEDESKVKEATDALRVLFPITSTRADDSSEEHVAPPASFITQMRFKSRDGGSVALSAIPTPSSPVPSPHIRPAIPLAPDTSPTHYMSRLPSADEAGGMEIDEESWLDESGELPVRVDPEDSFSDIDIASNIGDVATPDDRHQDTAEWAREAAESTVLGVKEELQDYPSPIGTDVIDETSPLPNTSRASSAETQSPSSRSSELLDFSQDVDYDDLACGPEIVDIDEIEALMRYPQGRTPRKSKRSYSTPISRNKISASWGSIGVGIPAQPLLSTPAIRSHSPAKPRLLRPSTRRQLSSHTETPTLILPDEQEVDGMLLDDADEAIGPEDVEKAQREAEAREEAKRAAQRERCAQQKALLEAYRQKMCDSCPDAAFSFDDALSMWDQWGSSDSLNTISPSALSPSWLGTMSMSALSLSDNPRVVNPRALHSPPIHVDNDDMMNFGTGCIPGMRVLELPPPEPIGALSPDAGFFFPDVKVEDVDMPVEVEEASVKMELSMAPVDEGSVVPEVKPSVDVEQDIAPQFESAPTVEPAPTELAAPAGMDVPSESAASVTTVTTSRPPSPPSATSTPANASPGSQSLAPNPGCKIIHQIFAAVSANIPVFMHKHEDGARSIQVYRRLDTDWINATSFLSAMGVRNAQQFLARRECEKQTLYAPENRVPPVGIVGVWVPLDEAIKISKMHGLSPTSPLAYLLRPDLFVLFSRIAKFTGPRGSGIGFGQPFVVKDGEHAPDIPDYVIPSIPPNPIPPNIGKGPLVRGANGVPEGCPGPKRRRATVIGQAPGKAGIPTGPPKAGLPVPNAHAIGSTSSAPNTPKPNTTAASRLPPSAAVRVTTSGPRKSAPAPGVAAPTITTRSVPATAPRGVPATNTRTLQTLRPGPVVGQRGASIPAKALNPVPICAAPIAAKPLVNKEGSMVSQPPPSVPPPSAGPGGQNDTQASTTNQSSPSMTNPTPPVTSPPIGSDKPAPATSAAPPPAPASAPGKSSGPVPPPSSSCASCAACNRSAHNRALPNSVASTARAGSPRALPPRTAVPAPASVSTGVARAGPVDMSGPRRATRSSLAAEPATAAAK